MDLLGDICKPCIFLEGKKSLESVNLILGEKIPSEYMNLFLGEDYFFGNKPFGIRVFIWGEGNLLDRVNLILEEKNPCRICEFNSGGKSLKMGGRVGTKLFGICKFIF